MNNHMRAWKIVATISFAAIAATSSMQLLRADTAVKQQIERGKYLVTLGGCHDCHTPGYFFGKPDATRYLGGSEVGFEIPGLGVFHGPNLTPDKDTGLGSWTEEQIVAAIQTGTRPDGRVLAPIMPWRRLLHNGCYVYRDRWRAEQEFCLEFLHP